MLSSLFGNNCFIRSPAVPASALALISLNLLTACGGGGGDGAATNPAANTTVSNTVAASSGGVLYSGPVTGLGSVVVNGVRFETIGAKVHESDDPYGDASSPDQVKLGMTVSIEGSADEAQATGTAGAIRVDGGIRGQVNAIDTGANTLTVSGQSIKVEAKTTVFQGASGFSGLSTSNWVEVYGLPQSDGTFLATRVEAYASKSSLDGSYPKASTYPVSLRGVVASSAANSFTLSNGSNGAITVNYRAADLLPAGSAIAVGTSVRVLAGAVADNAAVAAAKVLVLTPSSLLAASSAATGSTPVSIKLKGVVDSVSGGTIVVSGTKVDLSHAVMPKGMPVTGQVVEAKGPLSSGTLIASKLEFGDKETSYTAQPGGTAAAVSYSQGLYGTISGYTSGGNTFAIQGVTVKVDSATRYEQGYSTLADNMYVEVKGVLDNGALLARKVEVKGVTANNASGGISKPDAKSNDSNADAKSGSNDKLSSGGSSFEIYGTLTCSSYPSACSIAANTGSTLKSNLSAAGWSAEHGGYVADTALAIEAKGYLDSTGTYQVTRIERKL